MNEGHRTLLYLEKFVKAEESRIELTTRKPVLSLDGIFFARSWEKIHVSSRTKKKT